MALECELATPSIDNQLRPKTRRRYIVVGGDSWVDESSCSCSDAEKTPWLQSANHYEYDFPFTFQSPLILLAGDYGAAPRRMNVLSSEESSSDPATELAPRVRESASVPVFSGFSVVYVAVFIPFGYDSSLRWEYTGSCTVEVANVLPFFSRAAMVNAHPWFVTELKPVHNVLVCTVIVTEAFIAMASTLQFVNAAKWRWEGESIVVSTRNISSGTGGRVFFVLGCRVGLACV
ncbi:hypothetical protein ARMGADRAFT_1164231 [Armillaria gallica]|uniref:Uncharacterized protein n=1 Tax=Armillaria gallica TaxID=47427 RepID=A0A2H3DSZ8_ARMGA|nr:hypothetical protein ARMGADRAFT_1164231 [Armillaria gallica]